MNAMKYAALLNCLIVDLPRTLIDENTQKKEERQEKVKWVTQLRTACTGNESEPAVANFVLFVHSRHQVLDYEYTVTFQFFSATGSLEP